jgi:3-phosphoshikimate 1-carboxyvinyltransferase
MKLVVSKSALKGTVAIPASKSHTIRAVAIASLAEGQSVIRNPLLSGDTQSAVECYRALGAKIDMSDANAWKVEGTGGRMAAPTETIDVGNSGTTLRIAVSSAALAAGSRTIRLTGDDQIQSRPIGPLIGALNDLGARVVSDKNNDKAPVSVSGTLRGGTTSIECKTSQYLTSLLLAAPLAPDDTEIEVTLLNEPDYARMTLDWLDKQGIRYEREQMRRFKIYGKQRYRPFDLPIPADFSSATFFLCAGAMLDADITLTGLDFKDSQPDKAVADYLKRMGADISVQGDAVRVRGSRLHGIDIDMNKTPDALPAMAVTGAFASGETRLLNVPQARIKETDRIAVMAQQLDRLGAATQELPDGLVVRHSPGMRSTAVQGMSDHRIVMALSLALMALPGEGSVDTAEAVRVTFPEYVDLMKNIGARIEIKE